MAHENFFSTGQEKTASDLGATETWVFPKVVHLRLRDHSLLKFAPGARQVPVSLIDAEKEYLRRNGASPVEAQHKKAGETESASGESQGAEGGQGQGESGEGSKEESTSTKKVSKNK